MQIWQEFQDVGKTSVRLMDVWQQYKARILELAATNASTAHLLSDVDDMDEGLFELCTQLIFTCLKHLKIDSCLSVICLSIVQAARHAAIVQLAKM